jgi:hypothetical protein
LSTNYTFLRIVSSAILPVRSGAAGDAGSLLIMGNKKIKLLTNISRLFKTLYIVVLGFQYTERAQIILPV